MAKTNFSTHNIVRVFYSVKNVDEPKYTIIHMHIVDSAGDILPISMFSDMTDPVIEQVPSQEGLHDASAVAAEKFAKELKGK